MRTYRVLTWDHQAGEFSPQSGVPDLVEGLGGLKRALQLLKTMGYDGGRQDPMVSVERVKGKACQRDG